MRVYVTYSRYDRGESYSIYHIDTSMRSSVQHWKEKDLPNFLGYGPDDVSQLYLIRCDLTGPEIEVLQEARTSQSDFDIEFENLMDSIHEEVDEDDIIYLTSGEECFEILEWFQIHFRKFINPDDFWDEIPEDEDVLNDELQQILFDNEPVWDKVLEHWIRINY